LHKAQHGRAAVPHAFARALSGADYDSDLALETHAAPPRVLAGCSNSSTDGAHGIESIASVVPFVPYI
jgi:hypothetical protein